LREINWPPGLTDLHLIFKNYNFKNMNVRELIPAAGEAARLMRSLSHEQRLMVLCALGSEEKSVSELRRELGDIGQVPLSQQLMRLRADGLVEARRAGTHVYYRIAQPEVMGVIEALQEVFCRPPARTEVRPGRKKGRPAGRRSATRR